MQISRRGLARFFLLALAAAWHRARAADVAEITIDNFTFHPAKLVVPRGTMVRFINRDDIPHAIVHDNPTGKPLFKSQVLDTDDHYEVVLDTAGTYPYFCSLHPRMRGEIEVR